MSNPIERLTNSVIGGDSKKAALIVSETNLYYLTAFPSTDGALLLTSEQAYYLLDFRYTEAARARLRVARNTIPAKAKLKGTTASAKRSAFP